MRLIDADAYKADIVRSAELNGSDLTFSKILCQSIDERPTAYDVDKVVERLEAMRLKREEQLRTCADSDMADYFRCKMSATAEVIEIVKTGGME